MELDNAKRAILQTTFAPIDLNGSEGKPALPDPGRPAVERAARLRAFRPNVEEIEGALKVTTAPSEKALLDALSESEPASLIAAVYESDKPSGAVVTRVIAMLAHQRQQRALNAADAVRNWIEKAEDRVCAAILDAHITSARALDKKDGAGETVPKPRGEPTALVVEHPRDELGEGSGEGDAPGEAPSWARTLRDHLKPVIRNRLHGSCAWGARLQSLLNAGQCPDATLSGALSILGVAAPVHLDQVLEWASWKGEGDSPNLPAPKLPDVLTPTQPIGYLHLERLSFVPSGVQHGELIYSLPLAPGEQVAIAHKEWSNTEEEFVRIISDSFEDYSEQGVTDKTDMAQSTSAERKHSNAFAVSVSISGGYGPVNGTINSSYSMEQSDSESRQASLNHSHSVTKTASARTRKEHKISFRLAKKTQMEDQTTRLIRNPDPFNPVRYDYYQLMRRWRVNLHRYGVRLTYDLTIPEPAIDLLAPYVELDELATAIEKGFAFDVKPGDITRANWHWYASKYGAAIEPPPPLLMSVQATKLSGPWTAEEWRLGHLDELHLAAPEGYTFSSESRKQWKTWLEDPDATHTVKIDHPHGDPGVTADIGYRIFGDDVSSIFSSVRVWFVLLEEHERAWQAKAFQAVREAAEKAYLEKRQMLQERRERITAELGEPDALTLRKLEREELMKGVLRWLFGPGFRFAPKGVTTYYDSNGAVVDGKTWTTALEHEGLVSFLHQAIEWENINSFLYPYFWTSKDTWGRRIRLRHGDPFHEAFLRAGAARVVLPIRQGWERAFLSVLQTGKVDGLKEGDAYMTIAEEIENYAKTNYPGIVPANPDEIDPEKATLQGEGRLVGSWYEYTPTTAIDIKVGEAGPTEGEFKPPVFNPQNTWGRLTSFADAATDVLKALAAKLSPSQP